MKTFNIALACASVLLLSNPAFANSQAKFKKIEELDVCLNESESGVYSNGCFRGFVGGYEKVLIHHKITI